jgi:hypothetical protein
MPAANDASVGLNNDGITSGDGGIGRDHRMQRSAALPLRTLRFQSSLLSTATRRGFQSLSVSMKSSHVCGDIGG